MNNNNIKDIFIIGGGINGCGIARDLSGRGLSVELAEMNDIGGATSSASTKLFHGGLRYLEYFEFSLVKKALSEREVLLKAMPHISWPLRFVIPYHPNMKFDNTTPASKILSIIFPWIKGKRPAWVIRLGLFLYDHLGGRKILPPTKTLDLTKCEEGKPLKDEFKKAFEYSDCWVQDAKLVSLNAMDAKKRGAIIHTRTTVTSAIREKGKWKIGLKDNKTGKKRFVYAKCIINASGPWIENIIKQTINVRTREKIRLVRGSHIVVKKLYNHDKSYFFQGTDGRIMFAIPYEQDYTLIGTTDFEHSTPDSPVFCTDQEKKYICDFVNKYFKKNIDKKDIVWTYSGVRPLYDNGVANASATTRDYTFSTNTDKNNQLPLLNIFGGKITTYRRLAEGAFEQIKQYFPNAGNNWTATEKLSGGDFDVDDVDKLIKKAQQDFTFLNKWEITRLIRCYGTDLWKFMSKTKKHNGEFFGKGLTEAELKWLINNEFVIESEDALWRRTKMGLHLNNKQIQSIKKWFKNIF